MKIRNKLKDYFVQGSYSFMKPEIIAESDRSFPLMLNIEPTLACNLSCYMCPAHNEESRDANMRKAGMMSWELYTKIIDECAAEGPIKVLNMHKDGESLLHPRFVDMLVYAREKKAAEIIHFNTNLTFKDQSIIDRIYDSGVDDITLSVDAVTAEGFIKVKGKDMYDRVVSNVHAFFDKRAKRNLDGPFIRVKMLGTDENSEELEEFKKIWEDIADEVQVQKIHNFAGGLTFIRKINPDRYPCAFLFYSTAINWDGTVSICHRDFKGEDIMGDVNENTLKEVYTNEKYQAYLQHHIKGCADNIPLCRSCDNWEDGPNYGVAETTRLAQLPSKKRSDAREDSAAALGKSA
ncbi:MAG: radical SAM protein [Bdellovibrionales bacterium]|nr:radical SAM protein [Bdellovibrionales bacterium]